MTHTIKILPEYFNPTAAGKKAFELRKNDRNYQVGDTLQMKEWNGENYTGREIQCYVTYFINESKFGIAEGFCVLGTRTIDLIIPKKKEND
jgi:hypothetical protein